MKKTTDEELNAWRYQFPTAIVSLRIVGDPSYARGFLGEGKVLLHSVINAMKFNKLGQHQNEKRFSDGTVVRAKSIFGQNTVEIDVSKSSVLAITGKEECTITFVYLNKYVQPMRYHGEVRGGEQEGIDYIKTYYTFDKSKCPSCEDEVEWEFIFNYETKEQIDYYDNEPKNHCVYSQDRGCFGEIIERGKDEDGAYIIWKIYTESWNQTRSGLGYAKFHAMLKNRNTGEIICEVTEIIGVDCCLKDSTLRKVEIWWEDFGTCSPFIPYGGVDICKMPDSVPINGSASLVAYTTPEYAAKPLYAIPEINGGCIPFDWELSGPIILVSKEEPNGSWMHFRITEDGGQCNDGVTITLKDRCGNMHTVIGTPCCVDPGVLQISYTSLQMPCEGQQELTALGGCGPYSWSITGGEGSLNKDIGQTVTYTAPDLNEDCIGNPTIQVTDCCLNTAEVKLAVNCSTAAWWSMNERDVNMGDCQVAYNPYCDPPYSTNVSTGIIRSRNWYCDGTLVGDCTEGWGGSICGDWPCTWETFFPDGSCPTCLCDGSHVEGPMNVLIDTRTPAMKAEGCCPINPLTGLPW